MHVFKSLSSAVRGVFHSKSLGEIRTVGVLLSLPGRSASLM